jgi:hypothetical protein
MGLMKVVIGDDPDDTLLRSAREVQGVIEFSIENLRHIRADLDNAVADLLEQRQREALTREARYDSRGFGGDASRPSNLHYRRVGGS